MASKLDSQQLSKIVRETIAGELKSSGETSPGHVARLVYDNHPDLVARHGEELALAAIAKKARSQLKSWFSVSLAGETQLSLPDIPADVLAELPPTITAAPREGEVDTRHILLSRATLGEFRQWEKMLADQIKADQQKHRAARFIVKKAAGMHDHLTLREAFGVKTRPVEA